MIAVTKRKWSGEEATSLARTSMTMSLAPTMVVATSSSAITVNACPLVLVVEHLDDLPLLACSALTATLASTLLLLDLLSFFKFCIQALELDCQKSELARKMKCMIVGIQNIAQAAPF